MIDKLFEVGVAQGAGIFFFLFLALGVVFWTQNKAIMRQNDTRETRYIATIDKLAESLTKVEAINSSVTEIRKDLHDSNDRQEHMLGRLLDRLPGK